MPRDCLKKVTDSSDESSFYYCERREGGRTGPKIACRSGFFKVNQNLLNLTPYKKIQKKTASGINTQQHFEVPWTHKDTQRLLQALFLIKINDKKDEGKIQINAAGQQDTVKTEVVYTAWQNLGPCSDISKSCFNIMLQLLRVQLQTSCTQLLTHVHVNEAFPQEETQMKEIFCEHSKHWEIIFILLC